MARKRKGVPRLRLRGWYDKFFEGSLPARQQQFLEAFHFKHSDKAKVDNVILQLFRCYGRQHDERIPVEDVVRALLDDDLDVVRDRTVPIPTPLVLALVLRKGFGRERGEKDTTYVGGKKAPTIETQELEFDRLARPQVRERRDRPGISRAPAQAQDGRRHSGRGG